MNRSITRFDNIRRRPALRQVRNTVATLLATACVAIIAGCEGFDLASYLGDLNPVVATVSPSSGPAEGGTTLLIVGEGFAEDSFVQFDEEIAPTVTYVSHNLLQVITPGHAPGMVDVSIVNSDGSAMVAADAFEFIAMPEEPPGKPLLTLASFTPASGPAAGGTTVTIYGLGFEPGMNVLFGPLPSSKVTYISGQILTAITPAQAAGLVDVNVINPLGESVLLPAAFMYLAEVPVDTPDLQVTTITPDNGPMAGGTLVTIYGSGFDEDMSVLFGPVPGTAVSTLSGQILTAVTPAQAEGTVDVMLINSVGDSVVLDDAFEFIAPAVPVDPDPLPNTTFSKLAPNSGPSAGGTMVTLQGGNFKEGTIVLFGGFLGLNTQVVSPEVVTVITPAYAPGLVDVAILPPIRK